MSDNGGVRGVGAGLIGLLEHGNIDLNNRPVVHNPDGSISTVRSITVTGDGGAYLLPTVVGGRVVSNDDAIHHFQKTGEHLGRFTNEAAASKYAQGLHESQARRYDRPQAVPAQLVALLNHLTMRRP